MLFNKKVLLASKSPRRHQLLSDLDISFDIVEINCDEDYPDYINRYDVPVFLSLKKSESFLSPLSDEEILLTADTVVICDDIILEKPLSKKEAINFLKILSTNINKVVTGVTLKSKTKTTSFAVCTEVYFGKLSNEEIEYYIEKYKPFDKAGAYGIQEWIGMIGVKSITGSYYNVVGLPVYEIYQELKDNF